MSGNGDNHAELDRRATEQAGSRFLGPPLSQRRPLSSTSTGHPSATVIKVGSNRPGTLHHVDSEPHSATGLSTASIKTASPIDLTTDAYIYPEPGSSDFNRYSKTRPRTRSPDDFRRSTSRTATSRWLNRVPESEEDSENLAGVNATSMEADSLTTHSNTANRYYGSVGNGNPPGYTHGTPLDAESNSDVDDEEEEWLLDEELARQGLYQGNYKTLVLLYTFVPLTAALTFIFLALLQIFAYSHKLPSHFPYPPALPFPLPELLTATALWSLSYLLRDFLYGASISVTSLLPFPSFTPILGSLLASFVQATTTLTIRLLAIPILLIPYYASANRDLPPQGSRYPAYHDNAFRRVWWIALGWAAAEALVGIKQGYESISLYKDVLVSVRRQSPIKAEMGTIPGGSQERIGRSLTPAHRTFEPERNSEIGSSLRPEGALNIPVTPSSPVHGRAHSNSLSSTNSNIPDDVQLSGSAILLRAAPSERQPLLSPSIPLSRALTNQSDRALVEDAVERDLEELATLKAREELEELYGIPVIRIPVFISCLHRINSILSGLGTYLLLSSAYIRSTLSYTPPSIQDFVQNMETPSKPRSNRPLIITFCSLLAVESLLGFMHTPWILPKMGIHTLVYVGLLVSLGMFFGGLGVWEALT